MTKIFGVLAGIVVVLIPIMWFILLVRWLCKKSIKKIGVATITCIGLVLVFTVLGVLTDPVTWCNHEYVVVEEVSPTCTKKGKVVRECSLCSNENTKYIDKLNHFWEIESVISATCTSDGYTIEKCKECFVTQRTNKTSALGHAMEVYSQVEPTNSSNGEIIYKCDRCDYEEKEVLDKIPDTPDQSDENYVSGEQVDGTIEDITSDNIVEKLCSFGFTESEARGIREIFLKCGLTNIDNAEPTNPNATIDGLIAYRVIIDEDRIAWFTIENREVFYIGLNDTDIYDTAQGGFLINIDDVHIPENEITVNTANELRDLTEKILDGYFVNALYYDGWRFGRADNNYMVQCEVYAKNKLGVKDWIFAKVWYEYNGTDFVVTGIVIDGVRYK